MRLVTQETPGDWPSVIAMVRQIILDAEIEEEVTMIGSRAIEPAAAA